MNRAGWVRIVVTLIVIALAAGPAHATVAPPATPLSWGPCEEGVDEDFECATIDVPLDHADPSGQSISIAMIRLPADPSRREGAVLFNPGGPGSSGFDMVSAVGSSLDDELGIAGRFDIIGFDPRGVDRSGGLRCQDDAEIDRDLYLDDTPDTKAEVAAEQNAASAFGVGCVARYGNTLGFYSTEYTARDIDLIRAALGDEQISYVGMSYGTYLGGVYAALFPDRVRAMVLDSAFEPTGDSEFDQYVTQMAGFEEAFANWAAWCEDSTECAFSAVDVGARWDALIARLDAHPVKSDGGRPVNQVAMETATVSALYDDVTWPALGAALAKAELGDGTALLALADSYEGRDDDGTFDTHRQAGRVIRCASGIGQQPPVDPAALLAQLKAAAPRFARGFDLADFRDRCRHFIAAPVEATAPAYNGAAPIVVIGGLNDPATPFRWAVELTALLGPSATLVTFSGEGHGQVLRSSCITEIAGAVITDLRLPAPDTECDPDPDVPRPAFWDEIPVPAGVGPIVEDPSVEVVLGLPSTDVYADVWFLTGDVVAVETAYVAALEGIGFDVLPPDTESLPGATVIASVAPDGTPVVVLLIPADVLASSDLFSEASDLAPDGQGFAIVFALGPS